MNPPPKHKLQDLIDMEHFQNLQDRLNVIYAFPSAIIDNDGNVLTSTAWQEVCTQFHRKNKDCLQECIKSDQYILSHLHEANPAVSYRCPHGLVDNATPIIIDGIHYGNFFTGQFFMEKPDLAFFQSQAHKYGFDEAAYLAAVGKVPIWTQQQLNSYLFFIEGLIIFISESGLKRLREIELKEQIDESLERQRLILQITTDGFWQTDLQGRLLAVNEAYCRMSGYSVQELLAMHIPDLEVEESATETASHIQRVSTQGEDRFESRHRRKDGSTFDVEVGVHYRPTEGGRLFCFLRDITERKRAEESHIRLATAVDQAAETIVITDTQGMILYANPAFEKTTGYSREEVLGQNPRVLKSGKHDPEFYRRMWETLASGEVWHGHFTNRRKDGKLFEEEATISPVRDSAGTVVHYVGVKRDVTREVQLEAQFRQAQKMEAIGQLAGGVAHDFNNILAAAMMQISLLQLSPNLDKEMLTGLRDLDGNAKRGVALTRQLLMLSRRSVLEIRLLDLNEVVANVLKMLGRLLGEDVTLTFERSGNQLAVEADAGMMDQVLMNLVLNARDAMPHGGRIAIATEAVEIDSQQVAANPDRREGRHVCLKVADTGCGMDADTLQRIFEPFFTTKEIGKGTGLGLATVYGIVTQHRGWVETESLVGRGTTFLVYLPASTAALAEKESGPPQTVPRGQETLLVVEDDESVREMLVRALLVLGYRVLVAANGQEAMNLWRDHGRQIDLLLTDMVMPEGMTGLELAKTVSAEKPDLKIIISSGYSTTLLHLDKAAAHGIVYLSKPYDMAQLATVVRHCLDAPRT